MTKKKSKVLPEIDTETQRQNVVGDINNFELNQFDMTHCASESDEPMCRIDQHNEKGRILVATTSFLPGDLIFKERAFVSASWNEFHCIECFEPHKPNKCDKVRARYPKELRDSLSALEIGLADIDAFGDIDRARCFIKCMLLLINSPDSSPLQALLSLDTTFEAECLAGIQFARKKNIVRLSGIIPAHIPDDVPARLLSVLKCNSHEVEDVGGSGVFLRASMMEHSCIPNCNFVTETDHISVIAIRPIQEGEPLSIDYSQAFYRPTSERRSSLQKSHCFVCNCIGCTSMPDRCRAFHCPVAVMNRMNNVDPTSGACLNGIVSPIGTGEKLEDWKCLLCSYQLTAEQVQICIAAEAKYPAPEDDDDDDEDDDGMEDEGNLPERSMDDIANILSENVMLDAHYSVFWSLIKLGHYLAKQASKAPSLESVTAKVKGTKKKNQKKKKPEAKAVPKSEITKQAENVWLRVIAAADIGIPGFHNDKCNYLDCLAQVRLVGKDIPGAQDAWRQAFEMSCTVCGKYTKPTLQLRRLARRPPRTPEELMFHYQNVSQIIDQIKYEEDHESAALMVSLAESHLNDVDNLQDDDEEDDDDMLEEEKGLFYNASNSLAGVAAQYNAKIAAEKETELQKQKQAADAAAQAQALSTNAMFGQFATAGSSTSILNFEGMGSGFNPSSTERKPFGKN